MTTLREAAQQALEALHNIEWHGSAGAWMLDDCKVENAIHALRAALAEPEGGGNLPPPLQEATVQQQIEDTPPSDYRRGYWDGFNIGKREGRIEAEDELVEPVQEPVAWINSQSDLLRHAPESYGREDEKWTSLYAAPPQRQPLSGVEIQQIELRLRKYHDYDKYDLSLHDFARAIERAHGIGGNDESA